jgi:hypothetical protein
LSFDLIALGTVESRTAPSAYAVETDVARLITGPVKELGLGEQFPWLDDVASIADPIAVVDSCPAGVTASLHDGRLSVLEVPSLVVSIHIDGVLRGAIFDPSTKFYVGWEQRLHWSGPKWSVEAEWVGPELAPGSVVGVPLTYDRSGKDLLLAGEQPFIVDGDGRTRMNSIKRPPLVPKTFNGTTPAALARQIEECSTDESAALAGQELREARVRWVTAPLEFPPTAAYCNISFAVP